MNRDSRGRFASVTPKPEIWAIVGDAQVPFHDPRAIEVAAQVIEEAKPDHLVYDGDMIDFWSISRHQPERHRVLAALSLQEEIDRTIEVQDKLARGVPHTCKRHNIDGNHENSLERFLGYGDQKVLGSLRHLHMENVFQYRNRGFSSYQPYGEGLWICENLFVHHGNYVMQVPGSSVKKEIDSIGASVIMGHVHRRADIRFRQGEHEWRGIENGCLCQLSASYAPMTNWAHSITIVEKYDNRHWDAKVVDIITDDKEVFAMYNGHKFSIGKDYHDGLALPWRPHMKVNYEVDVE